MWVGLEKRTFLCVLCKLAKSRNFKSTISRWQFGLFFFALLFSFSKFTISTPHLFQHVF